MLVATSNGESLYLSLSLSLSFSLSLIPSSAACARNTHTCKDTHTKHIRPRTTQTPTHNARVVVLCPYTWCMSDVVRVRLFCWQCVTAQFTCQSTHFFAGVDTPMAGLWQHGDGKVTVALLTPGEGRRSKRVYWTPVTVPSDGDADAMWEQHMTIASLGVAPCRVISGVHAVNFARQHPLWCAAAEMPHTNEDGSVGAAFVTRPAVSASASIAREIEHLAAASHADLAPGEADEMSLEPSYDLVFNDFDSPPSPEVPPEEEVKLEVYDHVYDECVFPRA